ncbi:MAG: phosphate ABC transporter substrate-binding protein [Bacteroidota bacterium]
MKKIHLVMLIAALSFAFTPQFVSVKIKGSDTLLPLSQKWAEKYMKKMPGVKITVTGGGSGVGIASLIDGTTNIATSSRKIKMDERLKLQDAGKAYKELVVANDALSVVVHPSNKVKKLTREQLEAIYTGKIKNWKEVGGADLKIVMYSRETSSGTYEFFKEHVMARKNYANTCLMMPATGAIIQSVSQTPGAIGYVGMAYANNSVAEVAVSYDKGKTYVMPTLENAKNKTYPVVRPLYFYYLAKAETAMKPFFDYVLSAEGQAVVKEAGYVPLK